MHSKPALSRSALRGTLLFVSVLTVLFAFPDIWMYFQRTAGTHISYSDPATREAVVSVQRNLSRYKERNRRGSRYSAPPAAFDPNVYTLEEWMQLGLSEKQAAVVLKFTKYGVYSEEDLKKIFVISDELYALIKDSLQYPPKPARSYTSGFAQEASGREAPVIRRIDVNTATAEELMDVKGIGPFFAKQIVRRRDELGGFYDASQLMEVWKMDEEKRAAMLPYLVFGEAGLRKIDLNTATAEELKAHPYISWNLANSIVKLRSQNGPYRRVEDVKKSVLLTEDLYEKLKRYFTVDP